MTTPYKGPRLKPLVALLGAFSFSLTLVFASLPAAAQKAKDLRFARILGINFLPNYVMEASKLVEKRALELGVPELRVEWRTVSSGGAATDAMLAGGVDVVSVGPGNVLLLWDRTRGGVMSVVR